MDIPIKMPVDHQIDNENKLVITDWQGKVDDENVVEAFLNYQNNVKNKPGLKNYNDLLIFEDVGPINITQEGLRELASIVEDFEKREVNNKLAIVVKSMLGYGLARMYQTFRSFRSSEGKEIRIFREKDEALTWLNS